MNSAVLLLVLVGAVSADTVQGDDCLTPDGGAGKCISLQQCQPLLVVIQTQPITNASRTYLRKSQCRGFVGAIPKVCCPLSRPSPLPTDRSSSKWRSDRQRAGLQAHIVDNHDNVHLVNGRHCGEGEYSAIVDGRQANMYEFPWVALLGYKRGRKESVQYSCAGTIINSRYVLTAAHCINHTLTTVRLGDYDTSSDPDCEVVFGGRLCAPSTLNIAVHQTIVHPGYRASPLAHNIALVRLATPADLDSESVRPVCLPVGEAEQDRNLIGTPMLLSGWGSACNGSAASPILLKETAQIVANDDCHRVYNQQCGKTVSELHLCVDGNNRECNADSGGPLVAVVQRPGTSKYVQFGVTTPGNMGCDAAGLPVVYTRVGNYIKWILDTIQP